MHHSRKELDNELVGTFWKPQLDMANMLSSIPDQQGMLIFSLVIHASYLYVCQRMYSLEAG